MRRLLYALCLALLIPLLIHAWRILPLDRQPLVAEKYAGWSGVLRLWIFQGWPSGSGGLADWLNPCLARFEKRHPGVYVQPQYVDEGAIAALNESGIRPPDLLLFPPGLLDAPAGLAPLAEPAALRSALSGCGDWNGATYAVPVAMGGYLMAWNADLIDRLPDSWEDVDLSAPEPAAWRHWGAALLALCAEHAPNPDWDDDPAQPESPGLELGLALPEPASPDVSPDPDISDAAPCRLPEGFRYDDAAWQRFVNGELAAMPVSQRELCRLKRLSDQGKGPDWRVCAPGGVYSDQLLCLAMTDGPDSKARRELGAALLDCLLEDACQCELHRAGLFSVTKAGSGYGAGDPMATLDAALHCDGLTVPGCFGEDRLRATDEIVRKFLSNADDPTVLWRELRRALSENPNNIS